MRVRSRADRDEQHLLLAGRPAEVVRLQGRHQEQLERRIVVHRHAAVDEDERPSAADVDHLGRKVRGRRGARPHELPERDVEVPELPLGRLYIAAGLLEIGHGESVVALRMTISSNVRSWSLPRVVPSPSSFRSRWARWSSSYLYRNRLNSLAWSNMSVRSRRRSRGSARRTSRPRGTLR